MSKQLFEKMQEKESAKNVQWDLHDPNDSKPLSFDVELPNELFGIEPVKAKKMINGLSTVFAERQILKDAYEDVIQLEINSENLPTFKELRLKFVKIRTSIDKWHKTNKAFYLAGGRFVDAIKNKEIAETEEIESKLYEAEKFFENQEKQKAKELNDLRILKISPYVENADQMDFKEFSDEDFDDFVFGKKTKFEQRIAEEKAEAERLEAERIAREKAIEAQRIENEILRKEAEEKEAQLQKERAEAEAKQKAIQEEADKKVREEKAKQEAILKAEQEAKAKLEAELKAKKEAELKAENERLAKIESERKEAEKLAKAPIKKQMNVWIDSFSHGEIQENETSKLILDKFEAFKKWAKSEIEKL